MSQSAHETTQLLIERLIDEYGQDVYKIAYLYVKDKQLAEDVFQEVFYKVMKNHHRFRQESSEKTWITRITINTCKDLLRSSWFRRVKLTENYEETAHHAQMPVDLTKKEEQQALYDAIYKLLPKYKEILILYYFKEYTYTEISEILSIPQGTVQSRLSRAKSKLKQVMTEKEVSG